MYDRRELLAAGSCALFQPSASGIDEGAFMTAGSVEQWVRLRGEDRLNPALLYVHGGPGAGMSASGWPLLTRRGWEAPFTVVTWDQQGAAKTFAQAGRQIDPTLTMDQIAKDGVEIAAQVARRLGKRRIVLVGGSWGSHIAVRMIRLRPELFTAYVGTGQVVNTREGEALAYQRVLAKAKALGNSTAVKALEGIGSPPYPNSAAFQVQRRYANQFERPVGSLAAAAPGVTPEEMADFRAGFLASDDHFRGRDMQGPIKDIDLHAFGRDYRTPMFVFQGEDDFITPASLAESWVSWIRAPKKKFVAIEGCGHNVSVRSGRFLELLVEHVRPLAD